MKNPLRYQITEYDCGPTSIFNALTFLFEREEIPPEVIRNIMLYSLDSVNEKGQSGRLGTSAFAMSFLASWLDGVGKAGLLPVSSRFISGRQVSLKAGSAVADAISRNGVAVLRVISDVGHYVLLTSLDEHEAMIFDPYRRSDDFFMEGARREEDIFSHNFAVERSLFERKGFERYSLGPVEDREAVLMFNENTKIKNEALVEYMI